MPEETLSCPITPAATNGDSADHVFGFATRALHAGHRPDAETGARAVPIYQTTSYVFEDTAARTRRSFPVTDRWSTATP